jgi:ribose-phosphate pyrophosphokinase
MAARLGVPLAIIEKRRMGNDDEVESLNIIGEVEGCTAITFDDEISTGSSILAAASALQAAGIREVHSAATHGVFSGNAMGRLVESNIEEVVVTDTIPIPEDKRNGKVTVLSVAPLLGEAIHRIHSGLSVGAMFEQEW